MTGTGTGTGTKKVIKEIQTNTLDVTTGELLMNKTEKTTVVENEPDYIKLYLADIMKLSNVPRSTSDILYCLLRFMSYDNDIVIISAIKKKICKELKLSMDSINKGIQTLMRKEILIRKDTGLYAVNPFLFGRGKWKEIKELRLSIVYNENGRTVKTDVEIERSSQANGLASPPPRPRWGSRFRIAYRMPEV